MNELRGRGGRGEGSRAARWLGVAALLLGTGASHADDRLTLSGTWNASSVSESWSFVDWGEGCGPKPGGAGAGGGSVQIRDQGGELSIVGAGGSFNTRECLDRSPDLSARSHSGGGRAWRNRCSTPANDGRRGAVVTSIQATDSAINISETGEYEFTVRGSSCKATVTRSRSFSLVKRLEEPPPTPVETAAPAAPTAAPAAPATPSPPPDPRRCSGPLGEPARLEVTPSHKLVRAGQTFAFRASVLDDDGCPTGVRPTWKLAAGPLTGKASVDGGGTVSVAPDAGEGRLGIIASTLGKSVTVTLEVVGGARYDALLAAGELDTVAGADTPAVALLATGSIGGRTSIADDAARRSRYVVVGGIVGAAVVLGLLGLTLAKRSSRKAAEEHARHVEAEDRRRAAAAAAAAARSLPPRPRGKICPSCGEQYPAEATFCGKDATSLVPIN